MKKTIFALLLGITFFLTQVQVIAAEDPNSQVDYFAMSLEELMEVPVVVSSSRQANQINKSSTPINIITSEDIHYGGQVNIPELLQFVPGVDVVKTNRHLYGVGINGLHESISNHVLSLVDGRAANNPLFGGAEYNKLPLFLEDIERIEVVRGPGGAAWGANAYTGVVNIITKDPEDTLGYFGSTNVTEFGDTFTHLRYGFKKGDWAWRLSGGYESVKDSDDAGAGEYRSIVSILDLYTGFSDYKAHDFSRTSKFDVKGVYRPSDDIKISVGVGYSNRLVGGYPMMGFYLLDKDNHSEMWRMFTKIEREFDDGSSGHLQWFGNYLDVSYSNVGFYSVMENDIEAQYNFEPMDDHHLTIGGNFRWDDGECEGVVGPNGDNYTYPTSPYYERWFGLFGIDRWDVTDRWTLEAQLRGDWYSEVSTDWSSRFSALYDMDGTDKHILRFSVARSFRNPLMQQRELEAQTILMPSPPYPPNAYFFNAQMPSSDLRNERIWSFETGYSGQLSDHVTLNANAFYHRMSDLLGYISVTGPLTPLVDYQEPSNIDGGDAYGADIELAYKDEHQRLSVWYAYDHFQLDQENQGIRAFCPPKYRYGFNGRWFLDGGWVFNANYRFNDETPENPSRPKVSRIDRYQVCDLTISKKIANGNGEVMFGVSDLLDKTNDPVFETTMGANHTMPGRMFFGRVQFHF